MMDERRFLSCDWGTTAFRLRLVATEHFNTLAETKSKQGNAVVNEAWKKAAKPADERVSYYLSIIQEEIKILERTAGNLSGVPVIISGMASSTLGMLELPYKEVPFLLDGSDLQTHTIAQTEQFPHETLLISGVKTTDDVMRGEEVQVVGCGIEPQELPTWIIHPGTHSKHIIAEAGKVSSFTTYMTGEYFSLLSKKSILAGSVEENEEFDNPNHQRAFEDGVRTGASTNLLHASFLVRTNELLKNQSKQGNYHYLSGLLIGCELNSFSQKDIGELILAGEPALMHRYQKAMEVLGLTKRVKSLVLKDADEITLKGQYLVYTHQKSSAFNPRS